MEVINGATKGHKIPTCKENEIGNLYATKYRHVDDFSSFVFIDMCKTIYMIASSLIIHVF